MCQTPEAMCEAQTSSQAQCLTYCELQFQIECEAAYSSVNALYALRSAVFDAEVAMCQSDYTGCLGNPPIVATCEQICAQCMTEAYNAAVADVLNMQSILNTLLYAAELRYEYCSARCCQ